MAHVKLKVEDTFVINIVASKSRVAFLNKLIRPKLEDMVVFLAARLASEAKKVKDKKQQSTNFFWFVSHIELYSKCK